MLLCSKKTKDFGKLGVVRQKAVFARAGELRKLKRTGRTGKGNGGKRSLRNDSMCNKRSFTLLRKVRCKREEIAMSQELVIEQKQKAQAKQKIVVCRRGEV